MKNFKRHAGVASTIWVAALAFGWGAAAAAGAHDAGKLLVVDCLLPGQVRKLGTSLTFLTARRAVKTSAQDCEIRGGEYVAYDRGDHASAIKVWMPSAQEGDKVAQTYVGEIFEKGFGTAPDYAAAASWYRKAVEQGYARAQINLGFLYEKGLGVPKDPVAALNLYRKASGIPDAITLDDGTGTGSAAAANSEREVKTLRKELEETRRQLDKARSELEQQRGNSQAEIERLEAQRRKAVEAGNSAEVRRLETRLKQREDDLSRRTREVALLEQQMSGYRDQLSGLQTESAGLRAQLDQVRAQLAGSQKELDDRRAQFADAQKKLDQTRTNVERQKQEASSAGQAEASRLAAQLRQREAELSRQTQELVRIEGEAQRYRTELAKLEQKAREKPSEPAQVAMAPPSIQLIEPPVVLTRGPATVRVRESIGTREVVGRVTAPAGLLSFTVNDRSESATVDANGLFRVGVTLTGKATPVTLVAIDRQGKRSVAEFALVPDSVATAAPPPAAKTIPRLNFGTYYALVIGNENYQNLPKLKTAVADAVAVADVLTKKYQFRTTTLTNATRYQILSELNRLRTKLTADDNLLIYYAGHGELDKANLRGHWLPIDAEPGSDANWISSVAITDILNAMTVRHVLVVADSCYSGALTRTSIGQLEAGRSEEDRANWLKALTKMRTRVVLTSGGLQPVLDGGGGDHSLFAKYFLEVLDANRDVIEARRVYQELAARVLNASLRYRVEQVPQYAPIQFAGHESGDFLFVPSAN